MFIRKFGSLNKIMIKKRKFLRGFTVIEILVIIAVMGIMLSIAFVNLGSGRTSAKLDAAQREVASAIKMAQSNALQGKTASGSVPKYWGIYFENDKTYKIVPSNAPGTDIAGGTETYALSNGVTFSVTNVINSRIYFSVPNGNILKGNGTSYASGDTATATVSISGLSKTVNISYGGVITEN